MSIIKNTNKTLSFEDSINAIVIGIRTNSTQFIVETELGNILVERLSPISLKSKKKQRKVVEVYKWGAEPATTITIAERHNPSISWYAAIYTPFVPNVDQMNVIGLQIMATIFIRTATNTKWIDAEEEQGFLDMIMEEAYLMKSVKILSGMSEMIYMENIHGATSILSKIRSNTLKHVSVSYDFRRKNAVRELKDLAANAKPFFNTVSPFDRFWDSMMVIAIAIRESNRCYEGWNCDKKISCKGIKAYFRNHPDVNMSQCQVILKAIHSTMFVEQQGLEEDEECGSELRATDARNEMQDYITTLAAISSKFNDADDMATFIATIDGIEKKYFPETKIDRVGDKDPKVMTREFNKLAKMISLEHRIRKSGDFYELVKVKEGSK